MTLMPEETRVHVRRAIRFRKNIPQQGDALDFLATLSDGCSPLVFDRRRESVPVVQRKGSPAFNRKMAGSTPPGNSEEGASSEGRGPR